MARTPLEELRHSGAFFISMKYILATKRNMTTVFSEDGRAYAATILVASPMVVTQIKTKEKDGYAAVQVANEELPERKVNKAQIGHGKGKGYRVYREVRSASGFIGGEKLKVADISGAEVGSTYDISVFAPGDMVAVSATSKGKGFQGVVKRHGFAGGRRTHGQKHSEREPGSIGGGGRAGGRVVKDMRMAGRMGGDRITVKGLQVLQVLPETGELVIAGAVPGRRGTLVEIVG